MIKIISIENNLKKLFDTSIPEFISDECYNSIEEIDGYFIVKKENKSGLYSTNGILHLSCKYDLIEFFEYSKAIIFYIENKVGVFINNNEYKFDFQKITPINYIDKDGYSFYLLEKIHNGNTIFYQIWKSNNRTIFAGLKVEYMGLNLFKYQIGNKYGLMNFQRKPILNCEFSEIILYPKDKRLITIENTKIQLRKLNGKIIES